MNDFTGWQSVQNVSVIEEFTDFGIFWERIPTRSADRSRNDRFLESLGRALFARLHSLGFPVPKCRHTHPRSKIKAYDKAVRFKGIQIFDVRGKPVATVVADAGPKRLAVPPCGRVEIRWKVR